MNIRVYVGQRIHDLRVGLKMTQPDLADQLNKRVGSISDMERGLIGPRLNGLVPLANALHTHVADLFAYVPSKYSSPKRRLKLLTEANDRLNQLDDSQIKQIIDQLDVTLKRLESEKSDK